MTGVFIIGATAIAGASAMRWLRVAQREHYLPWSVSVFAKRWWLSSPLNLGLIALAATSAALALVGVFPEVAASVALLCMLVGPVGLSFRGTSAPLAWTARLRRVAFVTATLWVVVVVVASLLDSIGLLAYELVAVPLIVDVALLLLWPYEMRSQRQWVDQASARMAAVNPTVIGITGSFGKTTTKEYCRRLLASHGSTVATPASFNNKMGLARAINEHLGDGTDYFIAEMGTYGPGEIAEICSWIPPTVAVITAIGPVHLERFGSIDRVLEAKSEIYANADVVVLNIDDHRLAALAERVDGPRVITVSAGGVREADVRLIPAGDSFDVFVAGTKVGVAPALPLPTNLACAIGVLVALDIPVGNQLPALADATTPDHRQSVFVAESGITIIDDTYNANPTGAAAALERLAATDSARRVVVTPGMVELGELQYEENRRFAEQVGSVADQLVVVAKTNRKALVEGAASASVPVIVVDSRDAAVAWVRANLHAGDAVLYENDLPDHHP